MAPTYDEAVTQLYHSSYFSSVNDAQTYLKKQKPRNLNDSEPNFDILPT